MNLRIGEVKDPVVRENFSRIVDEIDGFAFLKGKWRFVEIEIGGAVTGYQFPHGLGFVPKDIIQTSLTGGGAITWNYTSFTRDHVSITTTGACTVRAFIGSYYEKGNR